jgi:DNA-directed RNA polymerase specialized sigma24 family protein
MLNALEPQLKQIARQVVAKHGNWRVEFDDMLQEGRIAAWEALQRAERKGLPEDERQRYALGAARKQCERCVRGMKRDAIWDAETGWNIDGGIGNALTE